MKFDPNRLNKLNLGCFADHKEGYVNIDIDPNCAPDLVADALKLHMLPDLSCSEILSSHLLEHFYEHEVIPALNEWNRLLICGGKLIVIVPDVQKVCQDWHAGKLSEDVVLAGFIGCDQIKSPWMLHKTFFWYSRLKALLEAHNYERVEEINKQEGLVWLQVIAFRR